MAYMGQGMMGGYGGYGGGMGMGGMYPGMGMGGGMYPGMGMGMGMGGYGMGMGGGMYPPMMGGMMGGGGYGMPRYPGGGMYGGAMGGMYGGGYGMDPYYGGGHYARYQGSTQDFPFHNSSHFHHHRPYPPSFHFPPPPPHYHRDAENLHNATRQYDTNGAYDPSAHHKLLGAMAMGYDPLTDRHNERPGQLQLMPGDTPLDDDPLLRRRRAPLAIAPAPLA